MSNPRNDRTFKQIFHEHPQALIDLLNAFLPLDVPIEAIEYMPQELQAEVGGFSMSVVDVRCRDKLGRHFIVEMQMQRTADFEQRVMMNAFRLFSRQILPGGDLREMQPVYTLCLLDYVMFKDHPDWIHQVEPMTNTFPHTSIKGVTITFVEIRKWEKFDNLDFSDHRNVWMLFFTQPEKVMEVLTPEQRAEFDGLIEAVNAWDLTKHSETDLLIMERKMDRLLSHQMGMRQLLEDVKDDGIENVLRTGLKLGMEQGIDQGMHLGKQSGLNLAIEVFKSIKEQPEITDAELMLRFQLSATQIRKIRESLNV
jgi:predicted transposase/invertase (TIGR01784 family)